MISYFNDTTLPISQHSYLITEITVVSCIILLSGTSGFDKQIWTSYWMPCFRENVNGRYYFFYWYQEIWKPVSRLVTCVISVTILLYLHQERITAELRFSLQSRPPSPPRLVWRQSERAESVSQSRDQLSNYCDVRLLWFLIRFKKKGGK